MTADLAAMSLSGLYGMLEALKGSSDPYAAGAIRIVEADICSRERARRERCGLTKRDAYGREKARGLAFSPD